MSYNINPIEDFSPLRHQNLVAEALGEVVPDLLTSLRQIAHPYRIDPATVGSVTTYGITFRVEEVSSGNTQDIVLTHTTTGTETLDEVYVAVREAFSAITNTVFCATELDYNEDTEKYLTVVSSEGFRIITVPTTTNLTIDTTAQVQAPNGKPASYGAGQKVLEQDYPKFVVTRLPITTVSENWRTGAVEKDLNDGNGLQFFPYYDNYIRVGYQVTCEAGDISDILTSNRPDSGMILRKFVARMAEENTRIDFYNKVSGTLNRDFTINPIPAINYTEFEDISVMSFSLDVVTREVEYRGNIVTKTTVVGAQLEDREGEQIHPIDFEVQAPSHPDP